MLFRLLIALVLALSLSNAFSAEVIDEVAIARIKAESLRHSEVGKTLGYLSDVYGPRLTGTPRYLEMVGWAASKMSGLSAMAMACAAGRLRIFLRR
jgi:hypothetical protein